MCVLCPRHSLQEGSEEPCKDICSFLDISLAVYIDNCGIETVRGVHHPFLQLGIGSLDVLVGLLALRSETYQIGQRGLCCLPS